MTLKVSLMWIAIRHSPFAFRPSPSALRVLASPVLPLWRCSSAGQSKRLISAVSGVQIPAPPPNFLAKSELFRGRVSVAFDRSVGRSGDVLADRDASLRVL